MWTLRRRYTILIVTHNMAQARRASDEHFHAAPGEYRFSPDRGSVPESERSAHGREYVEPLRLQASFARQPPECGFSRPCRTRTASSPRRGRPFHLPPWSVIARPQCSCSCLSCPCSSCCSCWAHRCSQLYGVPQSTSGFASAVEPDVWTRWRRCPGRDPYWLSAQPNPGVLAEPASVAKNVGVLGVERRPSRAGSPSKLIVTRCPLLIPVHARSSRRSEIHLVGDEQVAMPRERFGARVEHRTCTRPTGPAPTQRHEPAMPPAGPPRPCCPARQRPPHRLRTTSGQPPAPLLPYPPPAMPACVPAPAVPPPLPAACATGSRPAPEPPVPRIAASARQAAAGTGSSRDPAAGSGATRCPRTRLASATRLGTDGLRRHRPREKPQPMDKESAAESSAVREASSA